MQNPKAIFRQYIYIYRWERLDKLYHTTVAILLKLHTIGRFDTFFSSSITQSNKVVASCHDFAISIKDRRFQSPKFARLPADSNLDGKRRSMEVMEIPGSHHSWLLDSIHKTWQWSLSSALGPSHSCLHWSAHALWPSLWKWLLMQNVLGVSTLSANGLAHSTAQWFSKLVPSQGWCLQKVNPLSLA